MIDLLLLVGEILSFFIFILIGVAYLTLFERKILATIQRRRGPSLVGIYGLLQPLADGLKLLLKEIVIPTKANPVLYIMAPVVISRKIKHTQCF